MSASAATPLRATVNEQFKGLGLNNAYKLVDNARKGVSTDVFYQLTGLINMPDKELAGILHISTRTVSNYKENSRSLDPVEGEHLLKIVALYELGEQIFGNIKEFNYWLQKPFWGQDEKPKDWLVTPGGVDLLMDEMAKLAFGEPI